MWVAFFPVEEVFADGVKVRVFRLKLYALQEVALRGSGLLHKLSVN